MIRKFHFIIVKCGAHGPYIIIFLLQSCAEKETVNGNFFFYRFI